MFLYIFHFHINKVFQQLSHFNYSLNSQLMSLFQVYLNFISITLNLLIINIYYKRLNKT